MSKDSSYSYVHFNHPRMADLFEEFNRAPQLGHDGILVPPQHQPLNPEDEDDVVPDQHAAFGITRATQAKRESAWKDLGLEALMSKGPGDSMGGGSGSIKGEWKGIKKAFGSGLPR